MRYGSVCSGIEAATVAWRPLGWRCAFVSEVYEKLAGKSAVWAKMLGREYDPKYSQNICFKADKKKAESWYGRAK